MNGTNEKAVGVLDTLATAQEIMRPDSTVNQKTFTTIQAQFALKGHTLQEQYRADDGRVSYLVSRWGQSRTFTHLHDVQSFLTQIGGTK